MAPTEGRGCVTLAVMLKLSGPQCLTGNASLRLRAEGRGRCLDTSCCHPSAGGREGAAATPSSLHHQPRQDHREHRGDTGTSFQHLIAPLTPGPLGTSWASRGLQPPSLIPSQLPSSTWGWVKVTSHLQPQAPAPSREDDPWVPRNEGL